jgi:methyl-accepting chemotaxis protein
MTAGFENVSVSTDTLANSFQEVDSSITELSEAGRRIGSGIVSLLDASSATATAISQMDASIRRVKKNALDASSISEGVKTDAATGKRAVEESIAGMQAIRDSSAITAEVVKDLSLRVKDIGTILSVIDELAEQTDLLALNATIIAAQAGEQGKGFAVVADEIRELAERTSSSTREIASVIGGVQDETRRAVDAINLAETSISEGEKLAQHSGTALEKIVTGVEQASIQVNQIARAAVEQAHGSQSIRGGIERVAELIDQIATSAAEQTKTCQRIASAIERMKLMAFQVRSTALDQGQSSALISRQSGEISDMLEQLRLAGRSQLLGCAMLFRTLDDSRSAAVSGTRTARDTGSTINGLSKQIHLLEKELTGFRL